MQQRPDFRPQRRIEDNIHRRAEFAERDAVRKVFFVIREAGQQNPVIPRQQFDFVERPQFIAAIRRIGDALRQKENVHRMFLTQEAQRTQGAQTVASFASIAAFVFIFSYSTCSTILISSSVRPYSA